MANLEAPNLKLQPVSVTRKMAASLPGLRDLAQKKGLKIHHLGAGYPHPEVTDPRDFLRHQAAYFAYLEDQEGLNDAAQVPEYLRESYSYSDTLGPLSARIAFAEVYGRDWGVTIDPAKVIPTVGATGGINLICSMSERPGLPVAYITDAPTYAGFTARAGLCQHARIYSVDMDEQGAIPDQFAAQIAQARKDGYFVPFYYTVPDGHNPAGFSFSQRRREELLAIAKKEGILIVEDAPYVYINYAQASARPQPFFALDPKQTVHLFTGSKIGFPGPRIGFFFSEAMLTIADGQEVSLAEMALTESSSDLLFQNPGALRGFEALLHKQVDSGEFELLDSMWPLAERKLLVYRENREIMLNILQRELSALSDHVTWTNPGAGFFTVFTFKTDKVQTDDAFIESLVADHGIVVIPMYDFYPEDAKARNPGAGLDQLRLSFCFSESVGEERRQDLSQAVEAFCTAVKEAIT
ncbi:MAG: PLP-dependent aminotransferase family protein [Pseudomonadales bacterium]|nr:PLP-dependent aminotransferase family protein [Pseudomonadales bacterium]